MIKAKAAKDFSLAVDCRTTITVKKGDDVDVDLSSAQGMIDAGQIKETKNFAKMLDATMTKKDDGVEDDDGEDAGVDLKSMNKGQLEAYARKEFDVELDKRNSKPDLIAEVQELIDNPPEPEDEGSDAGEDAGEDEGSDV